MPFSARHHFLPLLLLVLLVGAVAAARAVERIPYQVVASHPHDPGAFTQGLAEADGVLYEGTGLVGRSTLREVDLATGKVLRIRELRPPYFGEGVAVLGGRLFQLTWEKGKAFVYGAEDFRPLKTFDYEGEGWGLTHNGKELIMSNGSDRLAFRDPETFHVLREVPVRLDGRPVEHLNELEYIDGAVFANVWQTNMIVRIDPKDGKVTGVMDLTPLEGLAMGRAAGRPMDVLNGIAWREKERTMLVTGKLWPLLFEIRLLPPHP